MDPDREGPDRLLCPACGREHPPSERFCASCGMPLVHPAVAAAAAEPDGATEPIGERREQARKIKPQYSEGKLVRITITESEPEAELIAGLLLEEGIPCLLRNSIGGYGAAIGPREVLVPASGAEAAREVLAYRKS